MGSDDNLRELRILAHQYRIKLKHQNEDWPREHDSTFQSICSLSQQQFQTYKDSINDQSTLEPWKRQNKARTEWLVDQASRLSKTATNESAWRMKIENAILERFSMEVACPICKCRLWRSEIESTHNGSGRVWTELDERRLKRRPCECSPAVRPQDRYEIGTSRLFEDRIEELVVQDHGLCNLKQKPDRIVGLKETRNLRRALGQPSRCQLTGNQNRSSFRDIQTQTALPIWLLLNLQKDLQSLKPDDIGRPEPLVWFLGYKGNDWKFYACYLRTGQDSKPDYNIHCLYSDDMTTNDGALRLLLLMDYIMDWARDTFRPSIITQLNSLASGEDFDKVSLGPDSDIISKEKTILEWISQAAPTILPETPHLPGNGPREFEDRKSDLLTKLPITKLGAVRVLSSTTFRLAGIRLTDGNIDSFLALMDGLDHTVSAQRYRKRTRNFLKEITGWTEAMRVLGSDLDYMEQVWTNEKAPATGPFDEGPGAEFYAAFEYRCFLSATWEVTRELNYFAISSSAFQKLVQHAAYRDPPKQLEAFPKTMRSCPSEIFKATIDCLSSGSRWQVLLSAISCRLFVICLEPKLIRLDVSLPISSLWFTYSRSLLLRPFIEKQLLMVTKASQMNKSERDDERARKRHKKNTDMWKAKAWNASFFRNFQNVRAVSNTSHDPCQCDRCRLSNQDHFALDSWDEGDPPFPTAYDAILVESIKVESRTVSFNDRQQERYDFSLFVLDECSWHEVLHDGVCRMNGLAFATVIEDLAQNEFMYHTFRHDIAKEGKDRREVYFNLPCPYRQCSGRQRWEVRQWIRELAGKPMEEKSSEMKRAMRPWHREQAMLNLLRQGFPPESARERLLSLRNLKIYSNNELKRKSGTHLSLPAAMCEATHIDWWELGPYVCFRGPNDPDPGRKRRFRKVIDGVADTET